MPTRDRRFRHPKKSLSRMSTHDAEAKAVNLPPKISTQVQHKVMGSAQSGLVVAALRSFTFACQPYLNFLESTSRTKKLPSEMTVQLMKFSQQMSDTLEHLVLTFADKNLITLDESEPDNMSHFCVGHIQLERPKLSVTAFRYCKPTPYLARVNTSVFKRMRWNVRGLDGAKNKDGKPVTEYYYLCYEDIPKVHKDGDKSDSAVMRMWSIGRWVQVKPDPKTEDFFDWVLCEVPEGAFQKLLIMGSQEPPSCKATDRLLQLLSMPVKAVKSSSGALRTQN
ncbi:UPF0575 protein C19orf67 homolog isoform X2 [Corythoichthys intestinalis]|uniref:UPF0575 protein C19orf67 homolog isoform X2 n=1 Tax=Corythoichthys intestinalis TaxID=161448 RepID=UPI0025A4FB03|nr:UPF0575 protein C19orf67 homolog isoform X2 [Corythoichthys intestinalis]